MLEKYGLTLKPATLLITLLFLTVFTWLSIWQVTRVLEKQAILKQIETANKKQPIQLSSIDRDSLFDFLYFRVTSKGKFNKKLCFYVENVVRDGEAGLYVYCPFKPEHGNERLLVNMGWVKKNVDRLQLPEFSINQTEMQIEGVLQKPRSKPVVVAEGKPNDEVDMLWTYFDFEALKQQTGFTYYPIELQLTSNVGTELQREWPEYKAKIGMHIGYAIHWAAFALATLVLFLKFNIYKKEVL